MWSFNFITVTRTHAHHPVSAPPSHEHSYNLKRLPPPSSHARAHPPPPDTRRRVQMGRTHRERERERAEQKDGVWGEKERTHEPALSLLWLTWPAFWPLSLSYRGWIPFTWRQFSQRFSDNTKHLLTFIHSFETVSFPLIARQQNELKLAKAFDGITTQYSCCSWSFMAVLTPDALVLPRDCSWSFIVPLPRPLCFRLLVALFHALCSVSGDIIITIISRDDDISVMTVLFQVSLSVGRCVSVLYLCHLLLCLGKETSRGDNVNKPTTVTRRRWHVFSSFVAVLKSHLVTFVSCRTFSHLFSLWSCVAIARLMAMRGWCGTRGRQEARVWAGGQDVFAGGSGWKQRTRVSTQPAVQNVTSCILIRHHTPSLVLPRSIHHSRSLTPSHALTRAHAYARNDTWH